MGDRRSGRRRRLGLVVGVCVGLAVPMFAALGGSAGAAGTTYYVATTGNDANAGTQAAPWRTIQRGADALVPGDTLLVRGGVYNEKLSVTKGGTSEATRVAIRNYPGETAVLDGTGAGVAQWNALLTVNGPDYVTIAGLEVRNSGYYGVAVTGASTTRIVLDGLNVHHHAASGIIVDGMTEPAYNYIRGSKVHDNAQAGIHVIASTGGYFAIENNEVYANAGANNYDAIQVGIGDTGSGTHHIVARNNWVHDNTSIDAGGGDAIDFGGRTNTYSHWLIDNNTVTGTNGRVKFSRTVNNAIMRRNVMAGEAFVDLYWPKYPQTAVYNNTLYGAKHGVQFYVEPTTGLATTTDWGGIQFRNNAFVGQTSYMLNAIQPDINRTTASMSFNGDLYAVGGRTDLWSLNEWWGAPNNQDPNRVATSATAAQIFTNAAGGDFTLPTGSPAIDTGQSLTRTTAAGSGTVVPVAAAYYFQDGYNGLIDGDRVQIGANTPVTVTAVNAAAGTITVATPVSWGAGDPVGLPWNGAGPDIGARESGTPTVVTTTTTIAPTTTTTVAPTTTTTVAPVTTNVTFDNPIPAGASGAYLNGAFQGIDFGSNKWRWYKSTATGGNYAAFDTAISARSVTFVKASTLQSLAVTAPKKLTLTITDNLGQKYTVTLAGGVRTPVTTGFTKASSTVTFTLSTAAALRIDDVTYRT